MNKANDYGLLVIDIQGKLANMVGNSDEMLANTAKLIRSCQILSIPVIVLEQNPAGLGSTAPAIKDSLLEYAPLEKYSFNGLSEPHIKKKIESLDKDVWLVAGIEAHICVYQTVKGLLKEGKQVEVVSDCISSRKRSNVELAVHNMRDLGAKITSVEMSIYEFLENSKSDKFKDVLKVIK